MAAAASSARRPSASSSSVTSPTDATIPGSRCSTAAARAAAATAAAVFGGPSVRVCCSWAFKNAGKAKSSRQLLDGAASSDPLADARLVVAALRAQIAAQEERVDKLHGLFDALKGEFEPEYVTYCAKVAGYVTLTVGAATDLPAASAADHFVVVSHGAGCCATRPVARGDGWDETFELAIANTHEPLVISLKASAWPRAKLVGVIRVALDTLLDQQPRSKREPFAETGKEDAPPKLGFKVAYRDAGADGRLGRLDRSMTKDGGHRYDRLLRALRQPSLWLAVALSEGVGIEDGDRLATALVNVLAGGSAAELEAKADPKAGAPPLLLKLVRRAVRDELGETSSAALVFRRNSIATKLATSVAKLYGRRWVADLLSEPIAEICAAARAAGAEACALEVDPEKMVAETVEAKLRRLEHAGSGGGGGGGDGAQLAAQQRRFPAACSASSIGSSRRPTRRRPRSPSSSSSSAARSSFASAPTAPPPRAPPRRASSSSASSSPPSRRRRRSGCSRRRRRGTRGAASCSWRRRCSRSPTASSSARRSRSWRRSIR